MKFTSENHPFSGMDPLRSGVARHHRLIRPGMSRQGGHSANRSRSCHRSPPKLAEELSPGRGSFRCLHQFLKHWKPPLQEQDHSSRFPSGYARIRGGRRSPSALPH